MPDTGIMRSKGKTPRQQGQHHLSRGRSEPRVANQFLSKTFSIGLRGYYYKQISGDSGSGAKPGDFKSERAGVAAGMVWIPAATKGKLVIAGRYMKDVHAKRRFKSDYSQLTLAWKF